MAWSVADRSNRGLFDAVRTGNVLELKRHLEADIDPDQSNNRRETPLGIAAANGHAECVHELLKAGAYVDIVGSLQLMTPLQQATYHGHVACRSPRP